MQVDDVENEKPASGIPDERLRGTAEPAYGMVSAPVVATVESAPGPSAPTREEAAFRIVLLLEDGEEVEAAFFAAEDEAEAAAGELVARIARGGEWPRFGSRFYRPERIAAVEIRRRPIWTGSHDRARWAGGDQPVVA